MKSAELKKMKLRRFGAELVIRVNNRNHTCSVNKLPITKGIQIKGSDFLGYYDHSSGNISFMAGTCLKPSSFLGNHRAVEHKKLNAEQQRVLLDCLPRKNKPHG